MKTADTISCSSQTPCLSVVNEKKNIFQGSKYLQNFEFTFQNGPNFEKSLLTSAEKVIYFTFFFIELLINYVGVIVPSFKLFDLV